MGLLLGEMNGKQLGARERRGLGRKEHQIRAITRPMVVYITIFHFDAAQAELLPYEMLFSCTGPAWIR